MWIQIKRISLKKHENILMEYWNEYITEWKIDSNACLHYIKEAIDDMWLYVAYIDDKCAGLLLNEEGNKNAIWLLHVPLQLRREGIGSVLFNTALSHVKGTWSAGQGKGYWWQGVPVGSCDEFLEKRGFTWSWTSIDMMLQLEEWNDIRATSECVRQITKNEAGQLLDMLKGEPDLSKWIPFYQAMVQNNQYEQIFAAYMENEIVGCAMVLYEDEIRWHMNFQGKTGGIGCLGVMGKYREKGIGASLAAAVTSELKRQSFENSYIGYTWLEDWYGKLGYRTIYKFKMGGKIG